MSAIHNKINHIKIADFFHLDEFQCPYCLMIKLHPLLLRKPNELRCKIQKPIIITSGYRCIAHNKKVGGVNTSYHLFGMAADIYVAKIPLEILFKEADKIGFNGIGYYPENNFLHLDIRPAGPVFWQG